MTGRLGEPPLDLVKQLQPVHAGHVDVGQDRDQRWLDFTREPIQCLRPRSSVMQDIRALAGLTTKPLPKKLGYVRFVVHDQDAYTHKVIPAVVGYWERGRRIVNSVNSSIRLSTSIVPPCCCVTMS